MAVSGKLRYGGTVTVLFPPHTTVKCNISTFNFQCDFSLTITILFMEARVCRGFIPNRDLLIIKLSITSTQTIFHNQNPWGISLRYFRRLTSQYTGILLKVSQNWHSASPTDAAALTSSMSTPAMQPMNFEATACRRISWGTITSPALSDVHSPCRILPQHTVLQFKTEGSECFVMDKVLKPQN
jgi:hypothetical protein